jgi:hypothetical protein
MYFMSRERYGRWFESEDRPVGNPIRWESNFERKRTIQKLYQAEMEEQGQILREIFCKRVAQEESRAVDYLVWVATMYSTYLSQPKEARVEPFLKFVQSDLAVKEENDSQIRTNLQV